MRSYPLMRGLNATAPALVVAVPAGGGAVVVLVMVMVGCVGLNVLFGEKSFLP